MSSNMLSEGHISEIGLEDLSDSDEIDIGQDDKELLLSNSEDGSTVKLQRQITLLSGVAINVGTIIGSGIFVSPKGVLLGVSSVGMTVIVWVLAGIISLLGALCFAELGTMFPSSGGFYFYLREIYGEFAAFLFLWVSLIMQVPASCAVVAITFGRYAVQPFFPSADCEPPIIAIQLLALNSVLLCGFFNIFSVRLTTAVQNVFTVFKMLALTIIIVMGAVQIFRGDTTSFENSFEGTTYGGLGNALYSGLFSYAGWYNLNNVVEELKNPYKNLPRAIYITMTIVTIFYVFANVAYFTAMTPQELLASDAVAVTFGIKVLGVFAWCMPVFVAMSTFGSNNGSLLGLSRMFFVGARDRQLPNVLAMIDIKRKTPMPSLLVVTFLTCVYVFAKDVYTLINYFNFVLWTSSGALSAGLLYLRWKKPEMSRPYKVFIGLPIFFTIASFALVVLGTISAPLDTLIGVAITLTGVPFYFILIRPAKIPKFLHKIEVGVTHWCQKLFLVTNEEKKK
ncbi:Y+L amino acid transporter 2-like isoform X1 [Asterias amurensis]|uniref:Y+L amino acid transporter 2-like isoform X1 n=1 Tax=Asterias amurensis TaxID=7602 RepID=UPI003AB32ECA